MTKKVIEEFESWQKRLVDVIQELEEDLERMRENSKIPQSFCNKRDAQIETIVNFNNAADELLKIARKRDEIASNLGQVPPSAIDLEETIVGVLILETKTIASVVSFLKPEHFYNETYRTIYQVIIELHNEGILADMRCVTMKLRKKGLTEKVGGPHVVVELTAKVSSAANLEFYSRCVIEFAIKRKLIALSAEVQQRAYDDTFDVFELLDYIKDEHTLIEKTHIVPNPKTQLT